MTPIRQSIALALASRIGPGGVSDAALDHARDQVAGALDRLRADRETGRLALLAQPARTDDLADIAAAAARLTEGASDVVVLGTGGSSLGAQALAQLSGYAVPGWGRLAEGPRLHCLDNLDPVSLDYVFARLPLDTTRFLAVSKSGGTGETLMQTMHAIAALRAAGNGESIGARIVGLTEAAQPGGRNGLRDLLSGFGCLILEHHPGIGGRYSCLTNVGLLPAAIAGVDPAAIRRGAADALAETLEARDIDASPAGIGAALNLASMAEGGAAAVLMPYCDRLQKLCAWWVQLWAESLGKEGRGTQPVAALGPVDQHSQQQLYLGGPRDKLFTIITVAPAGRGPTIDVGLAAMAGEPGFGGRRVGDLVAAQGRAMADTLARNGRPTRVIALDDLDARALGWLTMHFMLETILAGYAMGIDPFDQPAVEEAKILAKRYLAESA